MATPPPTGSLDGVLGHDPQTAAPSGAPQPTRRADNAAARRKAVARRRIAVAGVVVAALAVGLFLLSRGGGKGPLDIFRGGPKPEYQFDHVTVAAATTTTTKPPSVKREAEEVGGEILAVLDRFYTAAFVDDGQWGDYGDAWSLFDDAAGEKAQADVDVLTLGSAANDLYDSITPQDDSLEITVLTDRKDNAHSAVAKVTFSALVKLKDGTYTTVTSTGSFFLRRVDGEWRIYAYETNREEEAAEAPASASPSGESP